MSMRNTLPQTSFLFHSLLFLIVSSYFPIAGRGLGLAAAAFGVAAVSLAPSSTLLFGGEESNRKRINILSMLRCIVFVSAAAFMVSLIAREAKLRTALPKEQICILEGTLIQDSSFSSAGNYVVKLKASACSSIHGYKATAGGLVAAVGKPPNGNPIISYGVKVRLTGHFSENLFIFEKLQVLRRSGINDMREYLIETMERRLFGSRAILDKETEPLDSDLLSAMLLLGRSEDYDFPLKDLAQKCGCSHVLALSGMHLGILAGMCRLLERFGRGRIKLAARFMSLLFVGAFVFAAGPRPSLIRAALAFLLGMSDVLSLLAFHRGSVVLRSNPNCNHRFMESHCNPNLSICRTPSRGIHDDRTCNPSFWKTSCAALDEQCHLHPLQSAFHNLRRPATGRLA